MPTMVMTDPRTEPADTIVLDRAAVASQRLDLLLAAARWWRWEARLAAALDGSTEPVDVEASGSRITL
jgi:hypothetical protein